MKYLTWNHQKSKVLFDTESYANSKEQMPDLLKIWVQLLLQILVSLFFYLFSNK